MLLVKPLGIGSIKGSIYTCEDKGDTLDIHNHAAVPSTAHITIISRGRLRAFGHGWEKIVEAGDMLDFAADQWHGLEALEPDCKFVNIIK